MPGSSDLCWPEPRSHSFGCQNVGPNRQPTVHGFLYQIISTTVSLIVVRITGQRLFVSHSLNDSEQLSICVLRCVILRGKGGSKWNHRGAFICASNLIIFQVALSSCTSQAKIDIHSALFWIEERRCVCTCEYTFPKTS